MGLGAVDSLSLSAINVYESLLVSFPICRSRQSSSLPLKINLLNCNGTCPKNAPIFYVSRASSKIPQGLKFTHIGIEKKSVLCASGSD